MKRFFIHIFSLFFGYACIEVPKPKGLSKYLVYGIISPQSPTISIFVSSTYNVSQPIPIDSNKAIKNAIVKIRSKNTIKELFYNVLTKKYEGLNNGFVKKGEAFILTVSIKNDTITGTTVVPDPELLEIKEASAKQNTATVITSISKSRNKNINYKFQAFVDLNAPQTPFFYWGADFGQWRYQESPNSPNTILPPDGTFNFIEPYKTATVQIDVFAMDKAWYEFDKNLDKFRLRSSFTKNFEGPIYFDSNLSGALGIFSSENIQIIKLEIRK